MDEADSASTPGSSEVEVSSQAQPAEAQQCDQPPVVPQSSSLGTVQMTPIVSSPANIKYLHCQVYSQP